MQGKEWKSKIVWFIFAITLIIIYKMIDSVSFIFAEIGNLLKLLMPFIMAIIFAYIIGIPCKSVEQTYKNTKSKFVNKHARGFSVLTVYIILGLIIFMTVNFVMPALVNSLKELAESLPNYYNMAIDYFKNISEDSIWVRLNLVDMILNLQKVNFAEEILKWISLENVNQYIKGILGITSVMLDIFITVVVTTYILLEREDIRGFTKRFSKAIFNTELYEKFKRYYKETDKIFFKFISGQVIDAIVIGIICTIAMLIIKVKYATLLGPLIGIFNIIPYFGAIVAVVITILITIFTGGFAQALTLAIVIIILQQIDANIINPKILGDSLNLSPILIIFSVTIGGAYFGVLGMFLGVPVIAFIKMLIENFIEERIIAGNIKNN